MVNHANGSDHLFAALGRERVVLGFPSAAGGIENGVDVYVDVAEQPATLEHTALDIAAILRNAGFHVQLVIDMDSWLKRHAVFVTAIGARSIKRSATRDFCLPIESLSVHSSSLYARAGWRLTGVGLGRLHLG